MVAMVAARMRTISTCEKDRVGRIVTFGLLSFSEGLFASHPFSRSANSVHHAKAANASIAGTHTQRIDIAR
jgi:hypothetical protein